jgi:hypothetical protein
LLVRKRLGNDSNSSPCSKANKLTMSRSSGRCNWIAQCQALTPLRTHLRRSFHPMQDYRVPTDYENFQISLYIQTLNLSLLTNAISYSNEYTFF